MEYSSMSDKTTIESLSPASMKFKKKAGAQKFKEQRIFSSAEATDLTTSKCVGVLRGEGVIVTSKLDIVALLKLGSYGKGIFSRTVPCHGAMPSFALPSKRDQRKTSESQSSQAAQFHVGLSNLTRSEEQIIGKMSALLNDQEKRMTLHAEWKKEADQQGSKDSENAMVSHVQAQDKALASGLPEEKCASQKEMDTLSFAEHRKRFQEKWTQLEETDPYKMDEYLQLSSEEALYLSHDLNLLNVTESNTDEALNTCELWSKFHKIKNFFGKYAAYRYYRKKGWVPKSGIKYGVDFVLYKQGPVEYHSNYAIIVRLLTETEAKGSFQTSSKDGLTWRDVVAYDRVCSSVVKDLVLCHVIIHDGLDGQDVEHQFPDCLERLKIVEVLVKRWDPDKNR